MTDSAKQRWDSSDQVAYTTLFAEISRDQTCHSEELADVGVLRDQSIPSIEAKIGRSSHNSVHNHKEVSWSRLNTTRVLYIATLT